MYLPSLHHPGRFCISSRVSYKQLLRFGYFLLGLKMKPALFSTEKLNTVIGIVDAP